MAIKEVPPHAITLGYLAELEAIADRMGEGVTGSSGSSAQRFAVLADLVGDIARASGNAISSLETEVLKLRTLLDLHGVLDFDAEDPSAQLPRTLD